MNALVLITLLIYFTAALKVDHVMIIDYHQPCDIENMTIQITNISFGQLDRGMYTVSNDAVVLKDIYPPITGSYNIQRCLDRTKATCENYMTVPIKDACELLNQKDKFWSPFFESEPPVKCPVKAGIYRARNKKVDAKRTSDFFSRSQYYWKTRLEVYNLNQTIYCVESALYSQVQKKFGSSET